VLQTTIQITDLYETVDKRSK